MSPWHRSYRRCKPGAGRLSTGTVGRPPAEKTVIPVRHRANIAELVETPGAGTHSQPPTWSEKPPLRFLVSTFGQTRPSLSTRVGALPFTSVIQMSSTSLKSRAHSS